MNLRTLVWILAIAFFPAYTHSQLQTRYWFFGDHAGLKFENGIPVPISGQTYLVQSNSHNEGSSVISDSEGNLLMYSNGEKVWNRFHEVMPNGDSLKGGASATHAAMIVPFPGSDHLFYLFTSEDFAPPSGNFEENGFRYSVVDMCLDDGKGDIVPGEKNILLLTPTAEKIAVTRHANGIDYWIVVHEYYSDRFFSFQISNSGISEPVITSIGSIHVGTTGNPTACAIGQMKISPDGTKLALCITNPPYQIAELFSFSNSTGMLSNYISLPNEVMDIAPYGIEFSGDGSLLYVGGSDRKIFQFNAQSQDEADIIDSMELVYDQYTNWGTPSTLGMQLASNGKIYIARFNSHYLGEISHPNTSGIGCEVMDSTVFLGNNTLSSYSLPSFISGLDYDNSVVECTTGYDEVNNTGHVMLFPNANSGIFNLSISKGYSSGSLIVYNAVGTCVKSSVLNLSANQTYQYNMSELPNGLYLVTWVVNEQISTFKVLKQE